MKAKPATKAFDIQTKLTSYLYSNKELSEFEFKMYERDAKSIPDYIQRNNTLGLLYGVQKNDALMELHFESALSCAFDLDILSNYAVLLNHCSLFKKQKQVLFDYREYLNTPALLKHLLNVVSIYLDSNMAEFICKKAVEIKCDGFFINAFYVRQMQILEVRKMTNCSDAQIALLVDICSSILKKYNQVCDSLELETVAGGHSVFGIATDSVDILVDMNFELADRVSETPELDSCKLTAVFRPSKRVEL
ncbi:hypothetical protein [Gilliamella sp. BG6]|uniref:hypothetical protein n=1 Tax=unclassified Gilliamella TaxID=2685620 RepID=UPI003986E7F0